MAQDDKKPIRFIQFVTPLEAEDRELIETLGILPEGIFWEIFSPTSIYRFLRQEEKLDKKKAIAFMKRLYRWYNDDDDCAE